MHYFNDELSIGATFNESDLSIKFPNGSIIYFSGASTTKEINRFRGLALKLTYIDESQDFPDYLKQLIDDVIVPASFDNNGAVRLIGTPGPVPIGYFNFVSTNPKSTWSKHHWTMFDNPWLESKSGKTAEIILNDEMERRGVTREDPTIQREGFGQWVTDRNKLVIDYDSARNDFDTLPPAKYSYIVGIDLGYEDADAISVLGYSDSSATTYLVDEIVTHKQGITDLMEQITSVRKKYDAHKLVCDTGGLGKKIAEELIRRHSIPIVAADKVRKFENIELMNDALRTKRFMVRRGSRFAEDSLKLEWDYEHSTPDHKAISDRFHSDIIDSVLYAWKESVSFSFRAKPVQPKQGTPEWVKAETDMMEQATLDRLLKQEDPDDLLSWL